MASKTMIIVIVLLGVSISWVTASDTSNANQTEAAVTNGTTTVPSTGTTLNDTTTADMTTSTPQTQPTLTTSNDMTEPQTTTAPPTTSMLTTTKAPPEIGTWTVVAGAKNQTCMKMSFKGTITQTNVDPILIPTTAAADSSSCNDDESDFMLKFQDENMTDISVTLSFVMQDKETSYLYSSSITHNQTTVPNVQILFATPVGNSYQCNKQMISLGATYNLTLEDLRLQPFASFANHDFGKAYSCESPPSGPNAAVIVGLVLGAIILILVIAVVVLYRKKKGPGRGYNNFS
eukprot:XP_003723984.1 PREDICTED: uncharacterized protein P19A11.02c [Strongylocentrotus purpuratus]